MLRDLIDVFKKINTYIWYKINSKPEKNKASINDKTYIMIKISSFSKKFLWIKDYMYKAGCQNLR